MIAKPTEEVVRSADGTRIGFVRLGSGPAVIFVHGSWVTGEGWLEVAKRVSDEGHCCGIMDRRGRGRSGDGADYSLDREVEDIGAVLAAAGPDSSLVGHSSGAIFALEAARRFPIRRLVLYEPPLHFRGRDAQAFVDRIRASVENGRPEEAVTLFFREALRLSEDEVSSLRAMPVWDEMVVLAWTFVRESDAVQRVDPEVDRYREVSVPTLLLTGSASRDEPSYATRDLQEVLPDARTAILEGQGHLAHRAAPELVAKELVGFLNAS